MNLSITSFEPWIRVFPVRFPQTKERRNLVFSFRNYRNPSLSWISGKITPSYIKYELFPYFLSGRLGVFNLSIGNCQFIQQIRRSIMVSTSVEKDKYPYLKFKKNILLFSYIFSRDCISNVHYTFSHYHHRITKKQT
jgi:hypothetical protein